jgi:hypothetical protein
MKVQRLLCLLISCGPLVVSSAVDEAPTHSGNAKQNDRLAPSVVIAILARNKAFTLPYFLTSLENLNYPKDRISLWCVFLSLISKL